MSQWEDSPSQISGGYDATMAAKEAARSDLRRARMQATPERENSAVHPSFMAVARLCERASVLQQMVSQLHDRVLGSMPTPPGRDTRETTGPGSGLLDALLVSANQASDQLDDAERALHRLLKAVSA